MSTSNANNKPAPPYTREPPSVAELMAEIHQLRNSYRNLIARIEGQEANRLETAVPRLQPGRDIREALKPLKLEPFKGQANDVIPFLTQIKGYFYLFPTKLDTATKKVLFTAPLIQGNAKN